MKKTYTLITLLGITASQAATVIHSIGDNNTGISGLSSKYTNWTDYTSVTDNNTGTETATYSGITGSLSEGGETINFTYDIILTGTGLGTGTWPVTYGAGGLGDASDGSNFSRPDNGDTFSITLANFSDDNANFDIDIAAFTFFSAQNIAIGETWTANGTSYAHGVSGVDLATGVSTNITGTNTWTGVISNAGDGTGLSNVDFRLTTTAVPEPSSSLLVALAGLGLLSRKRR
ncbi:PEP-CTERM sorting domain-containing protein [Rubritalea tangerina]|uniref:PEP-CTERM sorting domain-containing protein n=1 Tax=Rubritalea tangerina TaxID=430798 RepID=A0ABW4ZDL9_9BACT